MITYIFDMDGTLVPSKQEMDPAFKGSFKKLCRNNRVYIVTGGLKEHVVEQLGQDVVDLCEEVFECAGNTEGKIDDANLEAYILNKVENSKFEHKTANHIDKRTNMWSVSLPGRDSDMEVRELYQVHDLYYNERLQICQEMEEMFPEYVATLSGATSLDICKVGRDKSQILDRIPRGDSALYFFGDRTQEWGNDYTLAQRIINEGTGLVFTPTHWAETWQWVLDKIREPLGA